ncbi:MAG: flagellar filament capping protein FliD [Oscillospiraceae bacterium]|nr:flagellar filament capping protein FliD [Oscillospiraceae bacterium]
MANVNSLSTSNSYSSSSSIYGNRNVLTGLASGMDTEAMIENAVSGYQTKIQQLQQSQEKLEWKQDAYREIIDQMYNVTSKYTSYTSATNLSSNSFFTSNAITTANGSNASAVTASGKAASDIQINAVTQLATAARYAVDASALNLSASQEAVGGAINWGEKVTKGVLSGTMTLKLGGSSIDIKFTDDDKYENLDQLVEGINKKLLDQKADVQATLSDGKITFASTGDAKSKGDSVYISGVSGNLKEKLDVATASSSADEKRFTYTSFGLKGSESDLTDTMSMAKYLAGKTIDVTLDGVTKSIKLGDLSDKTVTFTSTDDDGNVVEKTKKVSALEGAESKQAAEALSELLRDDVQASIDKEFGKNRVTVGLTGPKTLFGDNGAVSIESKGLAFDVAEGSGSTLKIKSSVGEELGIGEAGVSNYFNTSQKLGDLLGEDWLLENARTAGTRDETAEAKYYDKDGNLLKKDGDDFYRTNADGSVMTKDGEKVAGVVSEELYTDLQGNLIKKDASDGKFYRANEKGEWLYSLEINGATIDGITKDTALESLINKISSNSEAGVKVSYSNLTSQFVFTANETGAGGKISFDNALAKRLFEAKPSTLNDVFGENADWSTLKLDMGYSVAKIPQENGNGSISDWLNSFQVPDTSKLSVVGSDGTERSFTLAQLKAFANGTATLSAADSVGYTAGQDSVVSATVNGKELTLKRSTNVVEMDGMTVTLKSTFDSTAANGGDAITFKTSSDSDKIVDAIKSFVEDVNKLMTSVHDAYTTQPIKKTSSSSSKGTTFYEPLTEDDKNGMSEDAVKKYEEKAKTGLLFGDSDLRTLYDKLLSGIQSYGTDRIDMEAIGLKTVYSSGVTTLQLNETKLREALDGDPDKVRNVFTKTTDSGSATNGLMATLKSTLNAYGSTSLGSQGILVRKAGTKLSAVSLLNNNIQSQISNLDTQIESWQTKLSNRIDYYTKQFTALEQLMSTMNNQSSMLADLMGY